MARTICSSHVLWFSSISILSSCATAQSLNETSNSSSNLTSNSGSDGHVHGWVDQPNARGTIDIIFTSVFTIFISCYTILCLNVPSRNESWWSVTGRRVLWMGVAIAGPEFVLAAAAGQWAAAKRSVSEFRTAGHKSWTMRHAFFADMGGIELVPRDGVPFRINAKHLFWLVINGCLEYPDISLDEINDKSKLDRVSKFITTVQIAYLIIQCSARAVQGLAITTLELFALAIVVCAIAISWCWMHKPVDILLPLKVHMNGFNIEEVHLKAGPGAARPCEQTPMDFVDDLKPSWSLNIQTFMHAPIGPFERPIPRFGNDRFPWLELPHSTALSVATLVYAAVHMCAWTWEFPSHLERTLWRISSCIIFGSTVAFWFAESIAVWFRWNGGDKHCHNLKVKVISVFNRKTPASAAPGSPVDREASKQVAVVDVEQLEAELGPEPPRFPLVGEFWAMFVLALIYAAARMYLLVEAFYGLRVLPTSVFVNIDWMAFVPHI